MLSQQLRARRNILAGHNARLKQLADGSMINENTGEYYGGGDHEADSPGTFVFFPRQKAKRKYPGDGFVSFQEAFLELSKDRELRGYPRAVLDFLLSKLNFENWIIVEQREVCAATGIDKGNVSRAFKLLLQKQILLAGPKVGRTPSYRLNTKYGWRGSVENLYAYRDGEERKHLELIQGGIKNENGIG
jgi:hypothetical protein